LTLHHFHKKNDIEYITNLAKEHASMPADPFGQQRIKRLNPKGWSLPTFGTASSWR
jgi:hypothetical protein